jgi:hypothetical protein
MVHDAGLLQPGHWDLPAMGQQQTKHREDLYGFSNVTS